MNEVLRQIALTQLQKDVKYWQDKKHHYNIQEDVANVLVGDDEEMRQLHKDVYNDLRKLCDSMIDHYLDKYNYIISTYEKKENEHLQNPTQENGESGTRKTLPETLGGPP